jgi:iron complex outermembrane receptor protein
MLRSKTMAGASLVALTTCLPIAALAQASDAPDQKVTNTRGYLEEVIVTARKRDESQQSVPVAVSAYGGEELAANNISDIADIARLAPGLDQREGRKQGGFAIRGVGQTNINEISNDPGVAVYLDGIFLSRNDSQLLNTVDVQSVQVLRGPQGTLFGKNSVGGAIVVTTKDPGDELALEFGTRIGSYDRRDAQLTIDIPLIEDKVHSKLTLAQRSAGGYSKDIDSTREFGDSDQQIAVLQTLIDFNDDLSLRLIGYYNHQREMVEPNNCRLFNSNATLSATRVPGRAENYSEACGAVSALIDDYKVQSENEGLYFGSDDLLLAATLTWDFAGGTLKSISSWANKRNTSGDFDIDGTDFFYIGNGTHRNRVLHDQGLTDSDNDSTRDTLGQELQWSGTALSDRLQFTLGVFGSTESIDRDPKGVYLSKEGWVGFEALAPLPPPPPGFLYVRGISAFSINSYDNTSYAAFGQFLYDLTPSLQFTTGIRYTYERREIKQQNISGPATPPGAGLLNIPGDPTTQLPLSVMTEAQFNNLEGKQAQLTFKNTVYGNEDYTRVSPMLSLAWSLSDQFGWEDTSLMTYITLSEGFKGGGFTSASAAGLLRTFEPEFVLSTEIGFKLDALERSLRLNVAAYNSDYKDIQVLVSKIPGAFGAPEIATQNAGLARIQGLEAELTWLLSPAWMLRASGNYIDADLIEFDDEWINPATGNTEILDRSTEPFPFIPEVVYSLSLRYGLQTESMGDVDFVVSHNYRDGMYIGQDAGASFFRDASTTDEFAIQSLRITWTPFEDRSVQLSLYGNNILDKAYDASGVSIGSFGSADITPGKPAMWGLNFSYRWQP